MRREILDRAKAFVTFCLQSRQPSRFIDRVNDVVRYPLANFTHVGNHCRVVNTGENFYFLPST